MCILVNFNKRPDDFGANRMGNVHIDKSQALDHEVMIARNRRSEAKHDLWRDDKMGEKPRSRSLELKQGSQPADELAFIQIRHFITETSS